MRGLCFRSMRGVGGVALMAVLIFPCWVSDSWGGQLEDMLLENKQITTDQWVKLKADEERRKAKELEDNRGSSDLPLRERWYEKISIRGYAQLRYNHTLDNDRLRSSQGDRSIAGNNELFFRRTRIIISGQPHERMFVYIQPAFENLIGGIEQSVALRDFYTDLFLTDNKEWRIRAGLSKVPFGFENMQSSQTRLALDRNDALNSAVPSERDLGVYLYYTPATVRERFKRLVDSGLKGSGDYGMVGIGVYNGQGVNVRDRNKDKHVVFHSMYPFEFPNGQILEVGMDAYTGQYNVSTASVIPSNAAINGGVPLTPRMTNNGNYLDERVAWHIVLFPQPFGVQAEYMIGRGPELNEARTDVVLGSVHGGYIQAYYNYQCDTYCQRIIPFFRVQEYFGGRKSEANAPRNSVREWELGLEYQFNRAVELTVMYAWTQRTSSDSATLPITTCSLPGSPIGCLQTPYQLQTGNMLRFQLQWNF
jgi:Phosphate-selective porin O and P